MKNKKSIFNDTMILSTLAMMSMHKPKPSHERHGITLVPINMEDNRNNYCHIYKDGVKVNDAIVRVGGLNGDWKDGYMCLLHYSHNQKGILSSSGEIVIDKNGNTMYHFDGAVSDHMYHLGGILLSIGKKYINLLTKKIIIEKSYSNSISSKTHIFFEKEYGKSVAQINKFTGELTIIE